LGEVRNQRFFLGDGVNILTGLFSRKKAGNSAFLIAQVVAKHQVWFPAHNRGREAPLEALAAWTRQLQPLTENELILLITDNHARNRFLGKKWPPLDRY
jgi:hypothetical protein